MRLATRKILGWADAHYTRTGRWPGHRSGRVHEAPDLDWGTINACLEYGGLGLPGGSSLGYLLARHRGLASGKQRPRLSNKIILIWADRFYLQKGWYPTRNSGPVQGVRGESWRRVDTALRNGDRGLPGGTSLERLLARERGKALRRPRPLNIRKILAWADAYHRRHGRWPNRSAGAIPQAPDETWSAVDSALKRGGRGLTAGQSLARLLVHHRGAVLARHKKRLTLNRILEWADRHKQRTGSWPTSQSGAVEGVEGENWNAINASLERGQRGLRGGSSISRLLAARRGKPLKKPLPRVSLDRVLSWADRHHKRTGTWPGLGSGSVPGAPGITWRRIDQSLRAGHIGPRPTSLSRLLARHRGKPIPKPPPRLTVARILRWADEHYRRTGDWPIQTSGRLNGRSSETWKRIDSALRKGNRGLRGGRSLGTLLAKHRGKSLRSRGSDLTPRMILKWAEDHRRRTGRWPTGNSGRVLNTTESWKTVDEALRIGRRGLPGGSSVARLLEQRGRKANQGRLPRLTHKKILAWADHHRRRTGWWPNLRSGNLLDAPEETWNNINAALRSGVRGLPGGMSLARLLAKYRNRPNPDRTPLATAKGRPRARTRRKSK